VVAKNCEWWRLRPWLFFPFEGQEAQHGLSNAGARRSLQAVTDLTPPGIKFLLKSANGNLECTERYSRLRR
jgi:hypothetical protein